jgi:hypothetical protein
MIVVVCVQCSGDKHSHEDTLRYLRSLQHCTGLSLNASSAPKQPCDFGSLPLSLSVLIHKMRVISTYLIKLFGG